MTEDMFLNPLHFVSYVKILYPTFFPPALWECVRTRIYLLLILRPYCVLWHAFKAPRVFVIRVLFMERTYRF